MKYKNYLATAGGLALAAVLPLILNTTHAAFPPVAGASEAATPSRDTTKKPTFDERASPEEYAALMEREASRWEGAANVHHDRAPQNGVTE